MPANLTGNDVTPVIEPAGLHGTVQLSGESTIPQCIERLRSELLKNARLHGTGTLGVGTPDLYLEVVSRDGKRYLVFEVL